MANTIIIYQGDGSTTDFAVPFDYLRKSFVKVLMNSVTELKGGSATDTSADYYFVDATTIRLRKIVPTTAQTITIRRYTSVKERVASFRDGSVLYAKDLDTSQVQAFHIAEEARDVINDALVVDRENNWDARGKRIINVGNPVNDSDAVTYGVYKADASGAFQARVDAEKARDRAIEAEANSKESEDNAKVSEDSASASAELAKQWATKTGATVDGTEYSAKHYANEAIRQATIATTKASEAVLSASNASSYEASAQASKVSASGSASLAKDWANKMNGTVDNTEYSAKYYAKAAKLSEDTAATHKESASSSATLAKSYEVEAKKQADLAKSYANQAAKSQLQSDWNQTDDTKVDYIKNKPTIPTKVSQLTNDSNFATKGSIPTKVSQLTNDVGYLAKIHVDETRDAVLKAGTAYTVPVHTVGKGVLVYLGGVVYTDFTDVNSTTISFDVDIPTTMEIVVVV